MSWLAWKGGRTLPLLSVAAFLLRLTVLGVLFLVMGVWLKAQVDLVATALAFIGAYTVLVGFSLYRFAVSGRSSRSSTRIMP